MQLLKHFYLIITILLICILSGCATNKNSTANTSFTSEYPQQNTPNESANKMVNVMTHF